MAINVGERKRECERDRVSMGGTPKQNYRGYTDLLSGSNYLFTPAVKSSFHPPPGLRIVTPLHQRVVVGIFKCHFIPPICRLVQPVEITVSQPTLNKEADNVKKIAQSLFRMPGTPPD